MVSQETKVIGISLAAMGVAVVLFGAVQAAGVLSDWTRLIGFVLVAGFGVVAPQLYLARTDPRSRPQLGTGSFWSSCSSSAQDCWTVRTLPN